MRKVRNMILQKGSIECTNPNCNHTFTWVYQTIPSNKVTAPNYHVHEIYSPEKNEAMVNGNNQCYCPQAKCGTPHFIDSEFITSS